MSFPSRLSPPVQKILSWYRSENTGVLTNLSRILNHGYLAETGKMLILPVDQGVEHGPVQSFGANPPAYDPAYHFQLACQARLNAYAAPLGFLTTGAEEFLGLLPLILKINTSDSLYKDAQGPVPAFTSSVEEALRLGCVGVGFTLYPGSEARKAMYEEVARAAEYARKHGLVVVIWSYPRGKGVLKTEEQAVDVVAYAAHIAAQMGAHIIKVKPPVKGPRAEGPALKEALKGNQTETLAQRVRVVIQAAFSGKRIVIFSGGPAQEKSALLQEIKDLARGGAFGSIVGRNTFQRPFDESVTLLKEVMDIYKGS